MGKYNQFKYLKKTKARTEHQCASCSRIISAGEYYYKEAMRDRLLQVINAKCFCSNCYEKSGNELLKHKSSNLSQKEY